MLRIWSSIQFQSKNDICFKFDREEAPFFQKYFVMSLHAKLWTSYTAYLHSVEACDKKKQVQEINVYLEDIIEILLSNTKSIDHYPRTEILNYV